MPISQRVVQVCLFLVAAIATGLINLGAAVTIRRQGTLVYLLALGVLLAGLGRLVSISQVGLPAPAPVWLGYLIPDSCPSSSRWPTRPPIAMPRGARPRPSLRPDARWRG